MRNDILPPGAAGLTYEIRAVVEVADAMRRHGLDVYMENIGDPIAKGETIPDWMKEIVSGLVHQDRTWGYSPTRGVLSTREFLAARVNARGGVRIGPEDILFFNGLGDAIGKVYGMLNRDARVLISAPAYTTHAMGEAKHAGGRPLTYALDPDRGWQPDLDELRRAVRYNPSVSGILVINPDNPTGAVWTEETLRGVIDICREFKLFLVADEIYGALVYGGARTRPVSDLVGDLPTVVLKGISKELPWPGSRCGWMEVYNAEKDPAFAQYTRSIFEAKMSEVCATTLPQMAIPPILSHPEYEGWVAARAKGYERASDLAYDIFSKVPGLKVNRTRGAFYMSVVFERDALHPEQRLTIDHPEIRAMVERIVGQPGTAMDKRFVYYLLGAKGICVVPLSSFHTAEQGFRVTLLEPDPARMEQVFSSIAAGVRAYLQSPSSARAGVA